MIAVGVCLKDILFQSAIWNRHRQKVLFLRSFFLFVPSHMMVSLGFAHGRSFPDGQVMRGSLERTDTGIGFRAFQGNMGFAKGCLRNLLMTSVFSAWKILHCPCHTFQPIFDRFFGSMAVPSGNTSSKELRENRRLHPWDASETNWACWAWANSIGFSLGLGATRG